MVIERVSAPSAELIEALESLVPQLTRNNPPPGSQDLEDLLQSDANVLLIARLGPGQQIIGTASLAFYQVPTGVRAVIEDVIVDQQWRGLGTGEALISGLLGLAREKGVRGVPLTSNPGRTAANQLYVRMGFSLRNTNSYYYRFE